MTEFIAIEQIVMELIVIGLIMLVIGGVVIGLIAIEHQTGSLPSATAWQATCISPSCVDRSRRCGLGVPIAR